MTNFTDILKFAAICGAITFATPALSQDEPADDTAEPTGGIIFLKPPERALLGDNVGQTPTTAEPTITLPVTTTPTIESTPLPTDVANGAFASIEDEIFALLGDGSAGDFLRTTDFTVKEVGLSPKYQVSLSGTNVSVPQVYLDDLKLSGAIFGRMDFIDLTGTVSTLDDWESGDISNGTIAITKIEVDNIALVWGGISFYGGGALDVDNQGMLTGTIDLTFTAWNPKFNLGSLIGGPQATGIEILLSVLTTGDALTLPIVFDQGVVKIGTQVLGIAPPIR